MADHTPGPWAVGQYTPSPEFLAITNHSCVCDPKTLALIATCGRADDRQSQIDADLIAAAPELLKACQILYSLNWSIGHRLDGENQAKLDKALAAARDAVDRAMGGSR